MQFDKDMNSNQAELFLNVREFIIKQIEMYNTKVIEKYSQNITSFFCQEYDSGFCYIKTKDGYVHIGWFQGINLKDSASLLIGNGKIIRGQKIKIFDKTQKDAIESFIEQTHILLIEKDERKQIKKLAKNK